MNIKQAKGVPIGTLMEKLGLIPAKQHGKEVWYLSPFREEKTPSFHVNVAKNIWFDFGEGKGGNVIDFASYFLEQTGKSSSVSDALSWLKASSGGLDFPKAFKLQRQSENEAEKPKWVVTNERQIRHQALVKYLEDIDEAEVCNLEIGTGEVQCCTIDENGKSTCREVLK